MFLQYDEASLSCYLAAESFFFLRSHYTQVMVRLLLGPLLAAVGDVAEQLSTARLNYLSITLCYC